MELLGPFHDQATIDKKYTGEGTDVSPALRWTDSPAGTKSFVLICDDPDAPSRKNPAPEPWVHWVIVNVGAQVSELPEGISRVARPSEVSGAIQGKNSWPGDNVGYRGPMPPPGSGPHRYFFKLFALDSELSIPPAQVTKATVLAAIKHHVLAEAQLMGTYERA